MRGKEERDRRSALLVGSGLQPTTASENGFDPWHIPGSAGSVHQRREGLLHLATPLKQEMAAVLEWVDRILVAEAAGGLFFRIEGQAEAGINPTLADLGQAPYSRRGRQGVCDSRQACGVRNRSKTIPLFGKLHSRSLRPTGHILVTVQDDLGRKGRVSRDLKGDMSPLCIPDVKGIVVDVRHRLGALNFTASARAR